VEAAGDFLARVRANPLNAVLLDHLAGIGLADCWLVAGCLFQTCWNLKAGLPVDAGIADYDLFYFDDTDLSYGSEDREIQRLAAQFGPQVQLRNQARVHLWYPARFGRDYPRLVDACDGINRFPVAGTCMGIAADGQGGFRVHAPFGLEDIEAGLLRPNPLNLQPDLFAAKARSYQQRWPFLQIVDTPASLP